MSAFAPPGSVVPLRPDIIGIAVRRPSLIRGGHSLDYGVQKAGVGKRCAFHTGGPYSCAGTGGEAGINEGGNAKSSVQKTCAPYFARSADRHRLGGAYHLRPPPGAHISRRNTGDIGIACISTRGPGCSPQHPRLSHNAIFARPPESKGPRSIHSRFSGVLVGSWASVITSRVSRTARRPDVVGL